MREADIECILPFQIGSRPATTTTAHSSFRHWTPSHSQLHDREYFNDAEKLEVSFYELAVILLADRMAQVDEPVIYKHAATQALNRS